MPNGPSRAENFKRAGFIKTVQNCRRAASSAAALSVPVVLGDTNIKTRDEFDFVLERMALEQAYVATGSSYSGQADTFIWSECEVKRINNFAFDFTFEPAHLGKFHWDSEGGILKVLKFEDPGPGNHPFRPRIRIPRVALYFPL